MIGQETSGVEKAGEEAIAFARCGACGRRWYFERSFCPACGAGDPQRLRACGRGVVHAATLVCRAATKEARVHAPYLIVLVDLAEGIRVMAQGEAGLAIGDAVRIGFADFLGRRVPFARRAG